MSARRPVIRHFIACEEIEETQTPEGRQYSLKRIVHRIRPLPGVSFPRIHPGLSLFVMLSDAEGVHEFSVEVVYWNQGEQVSLWKTKAAQRALGADPLSVHGWPIRLRNILLPQAGDYDIVLWCDGSVLARETIHVGGAG
jgi:hypothetical protein